MTLSRPVLAPICRLSALPLLATLLAQPAAAQVLEASSDATIRDRLCLGGECADDPTPEFVAGSSTASLEIKDFRSRIDFVDTSTDVFPNTNWAIQLNEPDLSIASGGTEYFAIHDTSAGTVPFLVRGNAPTNALYVAESGLVGLQTSMPQSNLHIVDADILGEARIRLEETTGTPYSWDLRGNSAGFYLFDDITNRLPFQVRPGAPDSSIDIASSGNVGIGTNTPDAPLEVSSDDTFSFFRVTAARAQTNQSVDVVFTQGPLGTGEFRYNIVDGDGPEMRLNADGDVTITGSLTTPGSCSVGCDAVFDADYDLPSIEDHHARTMALGHLPNVGPTHEGMPIDLADKQGRILNELEHAHLYIAQLEARDRARAEENDRLGERIARLEAMVAELAAR
jgi:hypothetical protein